MIRLTTLLTLLAALVLGAGVANAAKIYEAELLPMVDGISAYGQATLIVDDSASHVLLTVNFAGLDSDQTGAELLFAPEDEEPSLALTLDTGSPLALTFPYSNEIGAALETDTLMLQISSENHPDGVLSGTFAFVTVGNEETSWTQVKNLFD